MVLLTSFFFIIIIDKRVNKILDQYIDIEVERLTSNIVSKAVSEVMVEKDYQNLLSIANSNGEDSRISYDTKVINKLTDDISSYVHKKLFNLEAGDVSDIFIVDRYKNGKFRKMKNGIVCDISLGSIRNSSLFANVGPSVPIKLVFAGQVITEIDIDVREYGINNVIVELDAIVNVEEHISMPITSRRKQITIKEPISIEIIKGKVPNYYNSALN